MRMFEKVFLYFRTVGVKPSHQAHRSVGLCP